MANCYKKGYVYFMIPRTRSYFLSIILIQISAIFSIELSILSIRTDNSMEEIADIDLTISVSSILFVLSWKVPNSLAVPALVRTLLSIVSSGRIIFGSECENCPELVKVHDVLCRSDYFLIIFENLHSLLSKKPHDTNLKNQLDSV